MLMGERESTIVTPSRHRGSLDIGLSPGPANKVCTAPAVLLSWYFVGSSRRPPSEQLTDCSPGWLASLCAACGVSHAQMTSSPGKCVRAAAHETLFLLHLPSFLPATGLLRSRSQVARAVNPRPNDATPHSSLQGPGCFTLDPLGKNKREAHFVNPSSPHCRLAGTSRSIRRVADHQRSQRSRYDPSAVTALKRWEINKYAAHRTTGESEILYCICDIQSGDTGLRRSAEGRHNTP
ncbi:hypothetical protein F5883DRAFT_61377 [Diaporthe sp. PMI_573]|nr:hypothetical protein F5883DRAFT_61377 [Diaporthaceae sp. PMI_573]